MVACTLTIIQIRQEVSSGTYNFTNCSIMEGYNSSYITKTKPEAHERVITKVNTDINSDNISEVNEQIKQNIIKNLDGTYSCQFCGKNSGKRIDNCRNHIETHLEGLSFNCPMCEKSSGQEFL